jgi:adenylate cyclase
MRRLLPIWLTLAVLFGAVMLRAQDPVFLVTLRHALFDAMHRWEPRAYTPVPVRIVDIDDESLARLGQWPLPRDVQAEMVDRLREMGAASIAFDIVFPEPDRSSPHRMVERLDPESRRLLGPAIAHLPDPDARLAQAIAKGKVVMGFAPDEGGQDLPAPPSFALTPTATDLRPYLMRFRGAVVSLPQFTGKAAGSGAIDFWPDTDGVVRRVPLLLAVGDRVHPSLALEAVRIALGEEGYAVRTDRIGPNLGLGPDKGVNAIRVGGHAVPTDGRGRMWMHFTPSQPGRYIPAWKLLAGEVPRSEVDGAVVIVGTSAKGLYDQRFTPLGTPIPGVEIQAQVVEQILNGGFLIRPDWADGAEILFIGLLSFTILALVLRFGPLTSMAIWGVVMIGTFAQSLKLFEAVGLLFDPVFPAITVLVVYMVMSVASHVRSEGERRWIREAFKSYISPNLVEQILKHPETLQLGGERRELSFVFTDLEGFTALVEKTRPGDLIPLLNEYLNAMIRIGFKHGGTLDKIVGDATAFFFNAPVLQEDHARRALACALEMDAFATAFAKRKTEEGYALGMTRIGVHTGSVIVGNMGGDILFNYCAHGDAINTASRLEGVNKYLGTRVCVSLETAQRVSDFAGRPIGRLMLKGKREPILAFEPFPPGQAESEALEAYLAAYTEMEAGGPAALAAFEELARRHPSDPLIAFHRRRLGAGAGDAAIVFDDK